MIWRAIPFALVGGAIALNHAPLPAVRRRPSPRSAVQLVQAPWTPRPPQLDDNESKSSIAGIDEPVAISSGAVAAGALASSAVIFEGVQIAGTAALFWLGQRWTGAETPVELVTELISAIQGLGAEGYAVFAGMMVFFQVVPIAAAFVLTVSAGAIFGTLKGTAMVLSCSTLSAAISFTISRSFARELVLEQAKESPQFQALDEAFGRSSYSTSLLLITLLRLSPVLPFSWANYIFGLSPVPFTAFSLGTFLGCLPAVAAYVNAGRLGAEIVVNGAEGNDLLLGVGIVATVGAITVAGNIASKALKQMDIDLEME